MINDRTLLHWIISCLFLLLISLSSLTVSEEVGVSRVYESCSSWELASIGKVWGFLKYHHPEFRRGNLGVDEFLFAGLKRICRESSESISSYFDKFVKRHSVYQKINTALDLENLSIVGDDPGHRPQSDIGTYRVPPWIYDDPNINLSVRSSLLEVFEYPRDHGSFYNQISNPTKMSSFDNEAIYSGEELTVELRILSLFRVWNAVEYYFPHKELIPGGWGGVLEQLAADFVNADSDTQYLRAIRKLLVRMEDGHATIFEDEGNLNRQIFGGKLAPILVTYASDRFLVKAVFDRSSNRKGGLVVGDSILSVDGKSVDHIKNYLERYTSSSNQHFKNQIVAKYLTISKKDNVLLEVEREGKVLKLTVDTVGRGEHRRMLASRIARNHGQVFNNGATLYVHINAFSEAELPKDFGEYQNVIVDLRGYPWKTDNADLMKYFLDKGVPFATIRFPSSTIPGSFETEAIARTQLEKVGGFEGSLFVLVDHTTISASEYIAMALSKARHSTIIGCQTAGADGNVAFLPLPGGVTVGFTGIEVLYPDGTPTQKVGVAVDVEVCDSQKSVKSGKDLILDRALEIIERSR